MRLPCLSLKPLSNRTVNLIFSHRQKLLPSNFLLQSIALREVQSFLVSQKMQKTIRSVSGVPNASAINQFIGPPPKPMTCSASAMIARLNTKNMAKPVQGRVSSSSGSCKHKHFPSVLARSGSHIRPPLSASDHQEGNALNRDIVTIAFQAEESSNFKELPRSPGTEVRINQEVWAEKSGRDRRQSVKVVDVILTRRPVDRAQAGAFKNAHERFLEKNCQAPKKSKFSADLWTSLTGAARVEECRGI